MSPCRAGQGTPVRARTRGSSRMMTKCARGNAGAASLEPLGRPPRRVSNASRAPPRSARGMAACLSATWERLTIDRRRGRVYDSAGRGTQEDMGPVARSHGSASVRECAFCERGSTSAPSRDPLGLARSCPLLRAQLRASLGVADPCRRFSIASTRALRLERRGEPVCDHGARLFGGSAAGIR